MDLQQIRLIYVAAIVAGLIVLSLLIAALKPQTNHYNDPLSRLTNGPTKAWENAHPHVATPTWIPPIITKTR